MAIKTRNGSVIALKIAALDDRSQPCKYIGVGVNLT